MASTLQDLVGTHVVAWPMRKVPNGQYFYMSVDGYTHPSFGRFNTSFNTYGSRVWHHMSVRASAARLATDEECLAFAIAALEVPSVQGG